MKDTALFAQLLGLCPPWQVSKVTPNLEDKSLSISIEWPNGTQVPCPDCGKACSIYDHREERAWRHLDTMQFKTLLIAAVPRADCIEHGVKSIDVPWADLKSRFTLLFERFAIDVLLSASSQTKAAELLGLSWDEVHAIQERAVRRGMKTRDLSGISYLGIDEKSFLKGHSYASLVYDLEGARVLEVIKDRTEEAAKELLNTIPEEIRGEIKAVAADMWKPYEAAIASTMPRAEIVHDKFHVVGYLNKAIDTVRKQENKSLKQNGSDLLKGTRYTWLKNPENWSEKDEATFEDLKETGLKVTRAWSIVQTFIPIWDYIYERPARKFFDKWYFWATHSRLKPIVDVAKMIKRHLDNILTFLKHRITNAASEGLNSKIQAVKAAARGFRNFENYRIAILFHCGGLQLHPQETQ
jgi:transposase